jgi:carbonic anhydrase
MSLSIRRGVAPTFLALAIAITLTSLNAAAFAEEHHGATTAPAAVAPQEALERLKAGNKRFVEQKLADKDLAGRRSATANGQQPYAIILACADSRVAPELVFDETIGDLFVVRVAGNVVDPDVLGSIEYAVEHLHARLIVVLGHEKCGAVDAAISGGTVHGNLEELIHKVDGGKGLPADKSAALAAAVKHNTSHQAAEMLNASEPIKKAVDDHQVQIEAAVYSLESGEVKWLASK